MSKARSKALAVMHVSSLDAYAFLVGPRKALSLAKRIAQAVREHDGPVFVIDQKWKISGESTARAEVLEAIADRGDVHTTYFDEDKHKWSVFLPAFLRRLRARHIDDVQIAGLWYTPTLKEGCATELYQYLRAHITKVTVRDNLVGKTEDIK